MANLQNHIAVDSETDCYALYDENGELLRMWQFGDDIVTILQDYLETLGVDLKVHRLQGRNGLPARLDV